MNPLGCGSRKDASNSTEIWPIAKERSKLGAGSSSTTTSMASIARLGYSHSDFNSQVIQCCWNQVFVSALHPLRKIC
jgi:hypothetical protein